MIMYNRCKPPNWLNVNLATAPLMKMGEYHNFLIMK